MPATARRSARREEVLDALVDLYLVEGFAAFTVEDLAMRLQCSKSTLYAVAPSKEQLITAVVRAFFRRATTRVEARLATETDAVARIRAYLDAIAVELTPASRAFYRDLDAFAPAREIYAHNTAVAARRLQDLVAEARSRMRAGSPLDAAFLGAVAAQTMESIQRGTFHTLTGLDHAAAYRALTDLVVAGVRVRS